MVKPNQPTEPTVKDSDRDRAECLACAHLGVKYYTIEIKGNIDGWWACELCSTEFVRAAELAAVRKETEEAMSVFVDEQGYGPDIEKLITAHAKATRKAALQEAAKSIEDGKNMHATYEEQAQAIRALMEKTK